MLKFIKRDLKKIILFIIFFIVIIPIGINLLFKIYVGLDFFAAEWTAGDFLSYYGVFIGSVVTIYGIYITIQYSEFNYREDVHNRVLPYIALTTLKRKARYSIFTNEDTESDNVNGDFYEEYRLHEMYFVICNGNIEIKSELSKEQKSVLIKGGNRWVKVAEGGYAFQNTSLVSMPMEIENVGNGAAINLRIGLNKVNDQDPLFILPINLRVNDKMYLHVFAENQTDDNVGDYTLSFYYSDIFGKSYMQENKIFIKKEASQVIGQIDLESKQIAI